MHKFTFWIYVYITFTIKIKDTIQQQVRIKSQEKLYHVCLQILLSEGVPHPFGIAVHDELIYWTDWVTHSIESANKLDGSDRQVVLAGREDLMDVHVFNRQRPTGRYHISATKYSKVRYLITRVGHGADPSFLAVSLQVTLVINPLLSTRPAVTFPAKEITTIGRYHIDTAW